MKVPVCAYCAVIGTMAICGLSLLFSQPSPISVCFAAGSVLFMISDSVLAIGHFDRSYVSYQDLIVMSTYILAQFLITLSVIL